MSYAITSAKELLFSECALYGLSWATGIWGGFGVLFAMVAARVLSACWKFCSILCSYTRDRDRSFRGRKLTFSLVFNISTTDETFQLMPCSPPDRGGTGTAVLRQLRHQEWAAGAKQTQLRH